MNLSTENKIMDLENRLMVAQGEGREWEGLGVWEKKNKSYAPFIVIIKY